MAAMTPQWLWVVLAAATCGALTALTVRNVAKQDNFRMTRQRLWAEGAVATAIMAAAVLWGTVVLNEEARLHPPVRLVGKNCPPLTPYLARQYLDQCHTSHCGSEHGGSKPSLLDLAACQDGYITTVRCECSPGAEANRQALKAHDKWPGQDNYVPRENNYNTSVLSP